MANKKNTKNPQSTLFRQLTRLFSGPITDYKRQNPRKLRRRQLDKFSFQSAGGLEFKKSVYDPYKNLGASFFNNQGRMERYMDFDQMEYSPELHSALDIYADEMTTSNEFRKLLTIKCPNEEIRFTLENLYHNILNIDFNLFGWCRTMCKYGDYFLYLDLDDETGVKNVIGLPAKEIERLEGEDPTNPNYVQYQWNSGGLTFENWQMAHFRILGNDKHAPYGTSVLDPARRIWRQLTLLEDAMMAYRIVRAPERRVFYIDTGNVSPEDVEQYMQKVMTQMKRNQVVDTDTGRVDLRYNPMSVEEDYWVPVRGNTNTRIENLPGGTYTGDIDDVKYLRDKLFSAIKIPASYLSSTDEAGEDKTTLSQKDIRFARTIQRLQRSIISELEKIGVIHLYTLGFRGADLVSFNLVLNNPSKISELQELEHWRTKFEVASAATEGFFSKRWIFEKLFNMSEDDINRVQREKFYDKKYDTALEGTTEEAAGALGGGAGFDTGGEGDLFGGGEDEEDLGDLGGEEDLGDLGGEETGEEESPTGGLITAPSKRDNDYKITKVDKMGKKETTTSKSKGKWHTPGGRGKEHSGPRSRQMKSQGIPGYKDIKSLGNGIVAEKLATTYKKEEELLFQTKIDIDNLIAGMENKNKDEV
tara:strand:+ start:7216 stop:9147 length:1932 start_codon:yes stop_codon:yes gene_type:complete